MLLLLLSLSEQLHTSPGLEILERSIFGFTSVADALSREEELDLARKMLSYPFRFILLNRA